MVAAKRRVAVFLPSGPGYFSKVFQGIGDYSRKRHHWRFLWWPTNFVRTDADLKAAVLNDRIEGVISGLNPFWEKLIASTGVAFVNVEYAIAPSLPTIGTNERAVGEMASEHFRDRGVRDLATVGSTLVSATQARFDGFVRHAAKWTDRRVASLMLEPYGDPEVLQTWLRELPKPAGIFCCNDNVAKLVHQACESEGIRIPLHAALLGVDNDDGLCEFLDPALSSIETNARRIGYEAAKLLDQLMDGQAPRKRPLEIDPLGVVARGSSDILAIEDREVAEAVQYIRAHALQSVQVKDVLAHVAVSRRALEKRFHAALGHSPRAEIHRVIMQKAKDLLINSDLSVPAIARLCGYPYPNHFSTMFRRQSGMTPTAFRKQTRVTE